MPYIKKFRRALLDDPEMPNNSPDDAGELNYVFTKIAVRYIEEMGLSYEHINDVLGALEGAKMEFYRRIAAPYEDTKIKENGDVY